MEELLSFICSFVYLLFSFPYWCCYGIMYRFLDLYGWFLNKTYNQEELELYSWFLLIGFGCFLYLANKLLNKYDKYILETTIGAVNKECRKLIEEKASLKKQLRMLPSKEEDIARLDNACQNTIIYNNKPYNKALKEFRCSIKLEVAKLKDQIQAKKKAPSSKDKLLFLEVKKVLIHLSSSKEQSVEFREGIKKLLVIINLLEKSIK